VPFQGVSGLFGFPGALHPATLTQAFSLFVKSRALFSTAWPSDKKTAPVLGRF